MGLISKTYKRYKTGVPRLEDLSIKGEPQCHARIVFTDSAKAYFSEKYQREKGLELHHLLFNLNESCCEMGLNTLNETLRKIKSELHPDDTNTIPNWNKSVQYILADCDIWFVTKKDINHQIEVYNRFTRDFEWFEIPETEFEKILPKEKSQDHNEKIPVATPDPLAFYSPINGCIVFFIDKINEFCRDKNYDNKSVVEVYNKVFLHELIHSCLDLYHRKDGKIAYYSGRWVSEDGDFTEESVDNALVLKCFEGKPIFDLAKEFIKDQPLYYKKGIELFDSGITLQNQMLDSLIRYKFAIPHFSESVSIPADMIDTIKRIIKEHSLLKKEKGKGNIYVLDDGKKIYLKNNLKDDSSPWTDISINLVNEFDYFVFNIKNKSFLLIPNPQLKEMLKEVNFNKKRGKYKIDIILTEDDVKLRTVEGKNNISLKEYFHIVK